MDDEMFDLLKSPISERQPGFALGHLEEDVMEVIWTRGESSVRDVVAALKRPLAYTTIMTTLDRLFKKSLLDRRKVERAFLYQARLSRDEWRREIAGGIVSSFLGGEQSRELLVSCFLDAVGEHDESLLNELEMKIRRRRQQLSKRSRS